MKEYFPKDELFEKLAAIEHERWADWQRYCFEKLNIRRYFKSEVVKKTNDTEGDNYKLQVNNWWRQIETPYKDLSEEEKDSDREQVMRYWYLIK